jgi:hypothetical protein
MYICINKIRGTWRGKKFPLRVEKSSRNIKSRLCVKHIFVDVKNMERKKVPEISSPGYVLSICFVNTRNMERENSSR